MTRRQLRAACYCGLPPFVGQSRSVKNPGRMYATCTLFFDSEESACKYFAWLDDVATTSAAPSEPPTPERVPAAPRQSASPQTHWPATTPPATASQPVLLRDAATAATSKRAAAPEPGSSERLAVFLLVVPDNAAQVLLPGCAPQERIRLLLLPASAHPPAHCTQHLAVQHREGQLPRAPASLDSLQPPYVELRHCVAARGLAAQLGWEGAGCGGLFALDSETTGLGGRDYVHQLAVLNLRSCQLLTARLRTCPRVIGRQAAEVCGSNNHALHDPNRPTFGQLAPLLHAFIAAGSDGASSNGLGGGTPPLLVAHNGAFDARMLIGEWARRGLPVPQDWRLLDTLALARRCVSGCSDYKQGTLRKRFGVGLAPGEKEHDAGTDVTVLAQLLPHLVKASGVHSLAAILEGRLLKKKNGGGFGRTFGDVQASMRGAKAGEEGAADAVAFTCSFCGAHVVA